MRVPSITLTAIALLACRPPTPTPTLGPTPEPSSTSAAAAPTTEPARAEPSHPPVALDGDRIQLAQDIRFDPRHRVHPDSRPILAELARFLREHPELGTIAVRSVAYDGTDHAASVERAGSVIEQLIAQGIEHARFEVEPGLAPGDRVQMPDARDSIELRVRGLPPYMSHAECSWWAPVRSVGPHVGVDDRNMLVVDTKIAFKAKHTDVPASSRPILDEVAAFLVANPRFIDIRIEVHLGDDWGRTFSMDPSDRRARSLRDYLVSRGVESYRIRALGFGEERPIADPRTPEGRAQNDRVEIYVESVPAYLEPLCDREARASP